MASHPASCVSSAADAMTEVAAASDLARGTVGSQGPMTPEVSNRLLLRMRLKVLTAGVWRERSIRR